MSSATLTRSVMRRILANQPIHHHHLSPTCHSIRRKPTSLHLPRPHSRSIFSVLAKGPSEVSTAYNLSREEMTLKRHTKALLEAYMLLLVNTRTAPKAGLVKTFKEFFQECNDAQELITDHQAGILLKILELLQSTEQGPMAMTAEVAQAALDALSQFDHGRQDTGQLKENPPFDNCYWVLVGQLSAFIKKNAQNVDLTALLLSEVRCLAQSGHVDVAEEHMKSITDLETWKIYVRSQFGDPSNMKATLKTFQEFGPHADDEITSLFIRGFVYAGQSDLARRLLHGSGLLKDPVSSLKPAVEILKACLEHNDSPTAVEIIAKVENAMDQDSDHTKRSGFSDWFDLHVLYQTRGKGIDAIQKILHDMELRHHYQPTIDTFNLLIKEAYQAKNANLGKSIIELAKSKQLELIGYTFLPQVMYKLRNGDLDGALATWDYVLYDLEPLSPGDMAEPMEELLIGILSASELRNNQFDELLHNHPKYARRFCPETVAVLVKFYLKTESYENVALLMKKHAPHFTSAARQILLKQVMDICRDETMSDDGVWNIYMMIKALFDEANRATREEILQICIKRGLVSKSLEIFKDMRDHWRSEINPTETTYLIALEGLTASWEAIMTVHNSLKLDTHVDQSTALLNALMRAYTRCGQDEARMAVEFWDELIDAPDGPNADSVVSVLEACSVSPAGYQQAEYVWDSLASQNVPITERILGAYVNNFVLTASDDTSRILEYELKKNALSQTAVLRCCFASAVDDSQRMQVATWLEDHHHEFWHSPHSDSIRQDMEKVMERLAKVDEEDG